MSFLKKGAGYSPQTAREEVERAARRRAGAGTERAKAGDEAALDGVRARRRARRGGAPEARRERRAVGYEFLNRDLPEDDDAAREVELGSEERSTGVEEGPPRPAATPQTEAMAFTLHVGVEPVLRRPIVPMPQAPDPAPERERIERELGIEELAQSLAEYGDPPVASIAGAVDRDAIEREEREAALADLSWWKRGARGAALQKAREQTSRRAEAQDVQLADEHEQLQAELDARFAELQSLRDDAGHAADEWAAEEMRRREQARVEQQAVLDAEWQQLMHADRDSVTATLRATLTDSETTVLGSVDGVALLVVTCPGRDELIAEAEPAFTTAGRRTMRARPEARRNDLYLSAIASRVLAAVGGALSTTPAVKAVACVAVRACESSDCLWEPLYVGTFDRAYAERLLSEGRWTEDPDELAIALKEADEVELELVGRTREIAPLDLAADPGLMAVMRKIDGLTSSDENWARASDQAIAAAFLNSRPDEKGALVPDSERVARFPNSGASGRETEIQRERKEPVELTPDDDADAAASIESTPDADAAAPIELTPDADVAAEPQRGFGEPSEELSPSASSHGAAAKHDSGAASSRSEDPLREALKDGDGLVRRAAVEAIGRLGDPNDTALLLEALKDQDDSVRLEAMYALKDRLSPDLRRDALIKACGDRDDAVRWKAIEALAGLGDERDTPLLLEALSDPNRNVRLEAIYAVKHRLSPDMRDALVKACGDVDASVRRKAFQALAELGDERDTPLLLKALKDSDSSVRLEAIYSLENRSPLGSASGISALLVDAVRDDDPTIRQAAVRLLGRSEQSTTAPRSP